MLPCSNLHRSRGGAITGLEAVAGKIGQAVAQRAAKAWLERRHKTRQRTATLVELAAEELSTTRQRTKLHHLVEGVGHQVADQLDPLLEAKFASLPDHEITAALDAVTDALGAVDLSDAALLADDADPEMLARRIRQEVRDTAGLSEAAARLYEIGLDQGCRYLVQVIRHLPSFQPRALAEVLNRASAQMAQLDEVLTRLPRTSLHAPRGTETDDEFREEYLRYVANALDRLELLGLSMKHRPKLALSVAYLSLSVSEQDIRTRRPRLDAARWFGTEKERGSRSVRVEAAIGGARRTLVRGEAGSGKTTLLDWLAVTAARGEFTDRLHDWNGCVPFAIRLRRYADSPLPRPEQFLDHAAGWLAGLMPDGWVHRVLRSGQALLLVDGVDEVPVHQRKLVRDWLREFVTVFPEARVVVTARPSAVDQRWLADEGFGSVLLEQMSPGDVRGFLRRWHEAARQADSLPCPPDQLPTAERRLLSQLDSRAHLRALAANPLLCAMLCALNLSRTSELPRSRMDLYQAALVMLLDLRDAERQIAGLLTAGEKTVLLRDLAWRLTLANRSELPRDRVWDYVARKLPSMPNVDGPPETILNHLLERSGVIREPVPGRVDFLHRTFQEYLAAEEATEDGQIDTLVGHAHLDAWWETIVMACGHAQRTQVNDLLAQVLDRAEREPTNARRLRLLAAACLETVSDIDAGVHDRIDRAIRDRLVPPRSTKESRSLASIGHRVLRYLPESLDDLSEAAAAATVRTAALTGTPDALRRLTAYVHDSRPSVRTEIINAWQYFDPQRYTDDVMTAVRFDDGFLRLKVKRLVPFAAQLPKATRLEVALPEHERVDSLSFLADALPLEGLTVHCAGEIDLAPLADHPTIVNLGLYGGHYRGMPVLRRLPKLVGLAMYPLGGWRNVRFLSDLPRLVGLWLRNLHEVTNYEPLRALDSMRRLTLHECRQLHNLRYVEHMDRLRTLDLTGCQVPDLCTSIAIEFLRLDELVLDYTSVSKLDGLRPLQLRFLGLTGCEQVTDVSPLADQRALRVLYLDACPRLRDLRPLAGMNLRLHLSRGQRYEGLDELGSSVRITYEG